MEPEKVAPEAISEERLKGFIAACRIAPHDDCFPCQLARELLAARQKIASLEQQLKAMTKDRDLWQDAHNDDCPNKILADAAERRLAALKKSHADLMGALELSAMSGEPVRGEQELWSVWMRRVELWKDGCAALARAREVQK